MPHSRACRSPVEPLGAIVGSASAVVVLRQRDHPRPALGDQAVAHHEDLRHGQAPDRAGVRRDLAEHPTNCTLAYGHHPRWSSGLHGSDSTLTSLWRELAVGGVDVYLAGHDHHYERFAPINGIRSFVVGTGGRSHYPVFRRLPKSVAGNDDTFGVLRLTLSARGYNWRFLPVAGSSYSDTGATLCR